MELVLSGLGSGSLGEGLFAPPTEGIRSHPLPHGFCPIWVTALVLHPHSAQTHWTGVFCCQMPDALPAPFESVTLTKLHLRATCSA